MLHVVLTTHNGGDILRRTLRGYARCAPPACDWRIIVVDNASDDDTPGVLRAAQAEMPLEALAEPRRGKNVALNAALARIAGARGAAFGEDDVVFTDDDAPPEADFLAAWARAFARHPQAGLFGGVVIPEFMEPPPDWLAGCPDRHAELYARNDRPEGPIEARQIFGPNMGVRGGILAAGHRFDEGIGPNGSATYAMGSETEFCVRVERETGARAHFARGPVVRHLVRPWQMTPGFYRARAYRHGRGVGQQRRQAFAGSGRARAALKAHLKSVANRARAGGAQGRARQDAIWQGAWWQGFRDGVRASDA